MSFNGSYNTVADSLNWADITIDGRTYLGKKTSLYFGGTLDLYALDSAGTRVNEFQFDRNGSVGRMENAFIALQTTFLAPKVKRKTKVKTT